MRRALAALLRVAGVGLALLGIVLLSPLSDLFPVNFSPSDLTPFNSAPRTSYYRIVLVEHSYWVEVLLIVAGSLMYVVGRHILQRQKSSSTG
jgi:hypothetical protein